MPLELYLIEFLHQTTTPHLLRRISFSLYLIEFLHQTTTYEQYIQCCSGCILLNFYIKPQRSNWCCFCFCGCILLNFYIKPQPQFVAAFNQVVVSYWISTSNHNKGGKTISLSRVVSYWISTSNHNVSWREGPRAGVVSYWISTSNHNSEWLYQSPTVLYLIEFLHQTTTLESCCQCSKSCILLNFYIKPQHNTFSSAYMRGCILLNFYIKPQQRRAYTRRGHVVSYWISTSNHNF